jgi:hypothetical protein
LTRPLSHWRSALLEKPSVAQLLRITQHLWNLKVHYCVHESPPLVCILSQINLIHTASSYIWHYIPGDRTLYTLCCKNSNWTGKLLSKLHNSVLPVLTHSNEWFYNPGPLHCKGTSCF